MSNASRLPRRLWARLRIAIFPPQCQRAEGVFDGVVVDCEPAVVTITDQLRPLPLQVSQRFAEFAAGRHARGLLFAPALQLVQEGDALVLADAVALIGRLVFDPFLDAIQFIDAGDGLVCERTFVLFRR